MPATTPTYGFPYPIGTDPVRNGDNDIEALALAVENQMVTNNSDVGLRLITSGSLSGNATSFPLCFSSAFNNYQIILDEIGLSGTGDIYVRFLKASDGLPDTSAVYWWAMRGLTSSGGSADSFSGGAQVLGYTGHVTDVPTLRLGSVVMQITDPFLTRRTYAHIQAVSSLATYKQSRAGMTAHNLDQSNSGIQFLTNSAVTMTGNVTIYGYKK